MERRIWTDIPQVKSNLIPQWPHTEKLRQLDAKFKALQKENYIDTIVYENFLHYQKMRPCGLTLEGSKPQVEYYMHLILPDLIWLKPQQPK